MKPLLVATAIVEAGTGLGVLIAPTVLAQVLLGAPIEGPAAFTVARVAGAALLALALACWLLRNNGRAMVVAMLLYNIAVAVILIHAAVGLTLSAIGLWPTIGLHTVLAGWCVAAIQLANRSE